MQPRVAGYTPSALVHEGKAYLVHDTGILNVLDAKSGKPIYRARVGGGGHTFSASPVAFGSRVLFLTEEGVSFVLDTGDEYKEIARERPRRNGPGLAGHRRGRALYPDPVQALQDRPLKTA